MPSDLSPLTDRATEHTTQTIRTPANVGLASIQIALAYVVVGILWILLSDKVLSWFSPDAEYFAKWQTYKGWIFVIATASLLQWVIHSYIRRLTASQKELGQSEERYRALFQKSPWPMMIYDVKTLRYMAVNQAALTQYGYTEGEFLARGVPDLVVEENRTQILDAAEARSRNVAGTTVVMHEKKDGTKLEVEVNSQPIYWRGRQSALVLAVDLTERRSLEAQLQQAQKMEAVGLLAGGVAHDFNNMLGVILGYAQLLQSTETNEEKRMFLAEIFEASTKAASVTGQLLAFSRKQVLQLQPIDLNDLVRVNEKLLQKLLGEHIEIASELNHDLWPTAGDPSQMVQVIMNLAVNARDAMPKGGKLIIHTENRVFSAEDLSARPYLTQGDYACLIVKDTGQGMDEATQKRIFEPFFTTKEVGKGTGLGLSTVYGIVKQSGGHVWVESEPWAGATFTVALPRLTDLKAVFHDDDSASIVIGKGERILLVEDEDALRKLLKAVLQEAGYKVEAVSSGPEALERIRTMGNQIDGLLTDVVMPRMSGPELVDRVREQRPDLPVLFVSGYPSEFTSQQGPMDPSVLLLKPFRREVLLARLRRALEKQEGA